MKFFDKIKNLFGHGQDMAPRDFAAKTGVVHGGLMFVCLIAGVLALMARHGNETFSIWRIPDMLDGLILIGLMLLPIIGIYRAYVKYFDSEQGRELSGNWKIAYIMLGLYVMIFTMMGLSAIAWFGYAGYDMLIG